MRLESGRRAKNAEGRPRDVPEKQVRPRGFRRSRYRRASGRYGRERRSRYRGWRRRRIAWRRQPALRPGEPGSDGRSVRNRGCSPGSRSIRRPSSVRCHRARWFRAPDGTTARCRNRRSRAGDHECRWPTTRLVSTSDPSARRSRTMTSTEEITMPSGASGSPATWIVEPGISVTVSSSSL